jgi:hypothetical protein
MKAEYWVSPQGEIIAIENHPVRTIALSPELFGYTIEQMQIIYAKYNDTNEKEGEATKTIIGDLIERGWIYSHRRNNESDWLAEVNKLDKKTRLNLQIWIQHLLRKGQAIESQCLRIYRHHRDLKTKRSVTQILEGNFFD